MVSTGKEVCGWVGGADFGNWDLDAECQIMKWESGLRFGIWEELFVRTLVQRDDLIEMEEQLSLGFEIT